MPEAQIDGHRGRGRKGVALHGLLKHYESSLMETASRTEVGVELVIHSVLLNFSTDSETCTIDIDALCFTGDILAPLPWVCNLPLSFESSRHKTMLALSGPGAHM